MGLFKRREKPDLRIFFATDVHGSDVCFRKFVNAARVYQANVILLGGDVAGKRLSPILPDPDGAYVATMGHRPVRLQTEEELRAFEKAAADAGLYTVITTPEELGKVEDDPDALERLIMGLARERLIEWLRFAEERLDGSDARLLINCGNDDPFELDDVIRDSAAATFLEGQLVALDDSRFVASLGFANQTPWSCPRDVPEEELADRMNRTLAGWSEDRGTLIFNCHCPPYDSGLDTAQQLNPDLSVVTQGGQPLVGPVGSTAVRSAIEQYRPVLSLHGHIHESRAATRIGPTLAINPGSEYPEGILRGAIVDLQGDQVRSYVLTAG